MSVSHLSSDHSSHSLDEENKLHLFEAETKRLKDYYSPKLSQSSIPTEAKLQVIHASSPQQLLGQRIIYNNAIGTVRYFGTMKHIEGSEIWVGLEWDEEGRGRHNGTVYGHTYFTCPDKKGSFIKWEKVQFGYKIEVAMFRRYFRTEELSYAGQLYQKVLKMRQVKVEGPETSQTVPSSIGEISPPQNESKQQGSEAIVESHPELEITKKASSTGSNNSSNLVSYVHGRGKHKVEYDHEAVFETLKNTKKILVQFIGFDKIWEKIHDLEQLRTISLTECRVCDLGPPNQLRNLMGKLRSLSLEHNLLYHWDQVYQLGRELPFLEELCLSQNYLMMPEEDHQKKKEFQILSYGIKVPLDTPTFPHLKCLVLIDTKLTWKALFRIIGAFPALQELLICKNTLTDHQEIDPAKMHFLKKLKFLNLEKTQLSCFKWIEPFGMLPALEKLTVNHNPLTQIGSNVRGFQNLKHLSIQFCALSRPSVLAEISVFYQLQSLNVKHNPFNDLLGNDYIRQRAVAEISSLKIINGAMLKKYERKDCQIFYMRESFREYFALKKVPDYDYDYEDFLSHCAQNHPNVHKLIRKFGNPYEVEKKPEIKKIVENQVKEVQIKKGTGMVEVNMMMVETDSNLVRRLPLTWTLASLRNFIAKTMKMPVNQQKLIVKANEESPFQEMIEDHKPLSFYNLRSGSLIKIVRVMK